MRETKIRIETAAGSLLQKAHNCFELAQSERGSADKQHEIASRQHASADKQSANADKLVTLGNELEIDAVKLLGTTLVHSGPPHQRGKP